MNLEREKTSGAGILFMNPIVQFETLFPSRRKMLTPPQGKAFTLGKRPAHYMNVKLST